jgi:hypothetical protein
MENSMEALKKLNVDLSHDPAFPLLEINPKECDAVYNIHNSQVMETAKMPHH